MYFFTADEHYYHANIIKYCNRPFADIEEMHEVLITNFNSVVGNNDITIHAGDFAFTSNFDKARAIVHQLNGRHIFLQGSHDKWAKRLHLRDRWCKNICDHYIVVDHYALRVWPRSHYNSWQLYGHSHGQLPPVGKQHDIGVDNNNYYPVSLNQIIEIMVSRPDNPNYIGDHDRKH